MFYSQLNVRFMCYSLLVTITFIYIFSQIARDYNAKISKIGVTQRPLFQLGNGTGGMKPSTSAETEPAEDSPVEMQLMDDETQVHDTSFETMDGVKLFLL